MNIEIKFRAWDGKRMTTSGISFNNSTSCLETPLGARMKLMQFTGLKDKNGVDIYEGDIVIPFTDQNTKSQIIFMNGCFKIATKTEEGNYYLWNYFKSEIEVIGNIYENPELL